MLVSLSPNPSPKPELNQLGLGKPSKKTTGNSLVFYQTGGGGTPPYVENQTSKGFPVFSEEKTGNWTKQFLFFFWGGGTPPLVKNQTISRFFF